MKGRPERILAAIQRHGGFRPLTEANSAKSPVGIVGRIAQAVPQFPWDRDIGSARPVAELERVVVFGYSNRIKLEGLEL
jgi:hypothetical protein